MVNETWKGRRRERGRARRYDPMAEPVQLPEGFVGKIRGALQVAVSDLRECLSWLDREIGTPMSEVSITLHLNREYVKPGTPDADDLVADVWFDDPHGGRNYQRFTWVYSDERMKDEGRAERMKDEGGRMKKSGRAAGAVKPEAARLEDLEPTAPETLEPYEVDVQSGRMRDEGGGMKKRGRGAGAVKPEAVRVEDLDPDTPVVLEYCPVDELAVPDLEMPHVDVTAELVPVAAAEGADCLSRGAELVVDDGGLVAFDSDVEVSLKSGEADGSREVERPVERTDVRNPVADADRLAWEDCAEHDSDWRASTPVPAGCEGVLCAADRPWRRWRWIVAAALLFGTVIGGWMLTGTVRGWGSSKVSREKVRVHVERVPIGVNIETPLEPRSGP